MVEEGKSGEDGGPDQPRLRSVLEAPPQHLQLGHLVRVELQQLKEVEEEFGNEKLFSSQLGGGRLGAKIPLAFKTTEEKDGKGCSVEVLRA